MPRAASRFTQTEVKRLVAAVMASGLPVAEVRVDASGVRVLTLAPPDDGATARAADRARIDAALAKMETHDEPET